MMCPGELLRTVIERATPQLLALTDAQSKVAPREGAWTPCEVLGHLVDSACNNHARFVRAQFVDDLVFEGYDQEAWVRVQRYDTDEWADLVRLWRAYNLHIARILEQIPSETLTRQRARHNLDMIAWRTVDSALPVTLEYFATDYVGHLENHLAQILAGYDPVWSRV